MFDFAEPDHELLKSLLEPLLEDFQYWFERSLSLLENHNIEFLGTEKQADLLARVHQAQQEVQIAQMLLNATDGKAGIDTAVLHLWHKLVAECWQVAIRFRTEHPEE
jgi:hypothetical protein